MRNNIFILMLFAFLGNSITLPLAYPSELILPTPRTMCENLKIQENMGGIKVRIDPAMVERLQNAPGFTPVIINIKPMTNIREFLGLKDQKSFPATF